MVQGESVPLVTRLTPPGSGGVAVLRVTGEAPVAELRRSFSGRLPEGLGIAYGVLRDPDAPESEARAAEEILDEVLILRAADPMDGAFPGAAFEIHAHGSPFLVAEIMERLDPGSSGHRPQAEDRVLDALPFAERARALVHLAPSAAGARILLDQAAGAMGRALEAIRERAVGERRADIHQLVLRGRARRRLFTETTVTLVGPVNAGKSTLFNVLVGADAASVSSEAGTTRDALLERARIGPWPVRFLDTAGERDLRSRAAEGDRRALVEQAGQRIAQELSERADLVLRLEPFDGVVQPGAVRGREVLLGTQAATTLGPDPGAWPAHVLSAKEAPGHARAVVRDAFESTLGLQGADAQWVPGEAVPFDDKSLGMFEVAAKLSEVDDRTLDALTEHL